MLLAPEMAFSVCFAHLLPENLCRRNRGRGGGMGYGPLSTYNGSTVRSIASPPKQHTDYRLGGFCKPSSVLQIP